VRPRKNPLLLLAFLSLALVAPAGAVDTSSLERTLLEEINSTRSAHNLPPLRLDGTLERAARAHSLDMLQRDYFSHGAMPERLVGFGARGPRLGENLAWGVGSLADTRMIVQRWLASPPHRANVLRPGFRRIGIGTVVGTFKGHSNARLVTADFAGT
jgi:uncharacterized protein YkwD